MKALALLLLALCLVGCEGQPPAETATTNVVDASGSVFVDSEGNPLQ
jgi:hypothetical protein